MPTLNNLFKKANTRVSNIGSSLSSFFTPRAAAATQNSIDTLPTSYQLKDRGVTVTDADIEAFRPLLYGEASNRPFDKKSLEGDVIFNTALNRQKEYARKGQKKTIAEILAMPNQYQAYNSPQYQEYHNAILPLSAAKKKEVDMIVDKIKERIKAGNFKDNTQGSYYYTHQKDNSILYDNTRPLFAK